jgi:hypothetical protein
MLLYHYLHLRLHCKTDLYNFSAHIVLHREVKTLDDYTECKNHKPFSSAKGARVGTNGNDENRNRSEWCDRALRIAKTQGNPVTRDGLMSLRKLLGVD